MRLKAKTALITCSARGSRASTEHVKAAVADPRVAEALTECYRNAPLDLLINNPGIGKSHSIDQTSDKER